MRISDWSSDVCSSDLIMPAMPMIAALSSPHLGAILFPAALRRLYVVRDDDPAGDVAVATLSERGSSAGIEVVPLSPMLGDHNEDLRLVGRSEEHTSELQSLMRISYAVFCLKKKKQEIMSTETRLTSRTIYIRQT